MQHQALHSASLHHVGINQRQRSLLDVKHRQCIPFLSNKQCKSHGFPVLRSLRHRDDQSAKCADNDTKTLQCQAGVSTERETDGRPQEVAVEVLDAQHCSAECSKPLPRSARLRLYGLSALAAFGGGILGTGVDTSGPSSIAGALAVLTAIVTVHEFGHFLVARAQGIHVTQFSIGFGPKLFSWKGKEVEYAVRGIPLGGFVGFPDDDPESEYKPDDPDLLRNRSAAGRLAVMSAGIIANCIFAFSILFTQASTVGMGRTQLLPGVKIPKIIPGGVAEAAGLQKGDVVVAVGGQPCSAGKETVNRLVQYIKDRPEKRLVFKVVRKEGVLEIPMVAELDAQGEGRIGAQLATYAKISRVKATGPIDAAQKAGEEFARMFKMVGTGLLSIVTNFQQSKDAVSGPLAIVAAGADIARNDAASLMQFAAIVNVNLAIVNALPLPALDGGYIFLILIEALRGKRLDKVVEQTYMASGFLLLTSLGLFLVVRDVFNLGQGLF